MVLIVGLYLFADVATHKGLARVLFPKTFPAYNIDSSAPQNKNTLINSNKQWMKAVNTKEMLDKISQANSGIECDVYFNDEKDVFDIHHDRGKSTGFTLDKLLEEYRKKELKASIWIDFKNLDDSNAKQAVAVLSDLRNKFKLTDKILVESGRADLLGAFSDSGFYTSYYIPLFNPYLISEDETKQWVDRISAVIKRSKASAISGYYFQYSFLHQYFPNYPILTWATDEPLSLVNWLFKKKVSSAREVFIILYP